MLNITPLRWQQIVVFTLGWLGYAGTYLLRKPLGVVKTDLETQLFLDKTQLGWLDTALLLPYAVMQILLGPLGDRFGARRMYGLCLILSALSMLTFGSWSSFYLFAVLLFINGMAQSQCWPNASKVIGSWYPDSMRNTIFGMFGTSSFAGGVVGTALAVFLQTSYGWRNAFVVPSLILGTIGVLVLLFFKQPAEMGMNVPGKDEAVQQAKTGSQPSLVQLCKIPMLAEVAISMFCLKCVRYCMYMWLPMYLLNQLNYSKVEAGVFSTTFEIGGVIGSATIGIVLDRLFHGRPLLGTTFSCLFSGLSLVLFQLTGSWGMMFNAAFLATAGAFNCGPDSILGGSVPAELGESEGRDAATAAVGLVNGFGSVGTFLQGPVIGVVATWYGWSGMFYFMIGLSLCSTAAAFRAALIQSKRVRHIPEYIPNKEDL